MKSITIRAQTISRIALFFTIFCIYQGCNAAKEDRNDFMISPKTPGFSMWTMSGPQDSGFSLKIIKNMHFQSSIISLDGSRLSMGAEPYELTFCLRDKHTEGMRYLLVSFSTNSLRGCFSFHPDLNVISQSSNFRRRDRIPVVIDIEKWLKRCDYVPGK